MSVRALMLAFASAPPGQVEFTTQGVHTWVVPDAVERLCMVAVQGAEVIGTASATVVTIAGTVVCRAQNGNRIGTGGGNGGARGG